MNYTVFYSWQSDLPNQQNRSFISDALTKAAKQISGSEDFELDAVVDRDTFGVPGSPSIVESITAKIAKSDVFVCDVSIINIDKEGRPVPNPNVMFELGFASAILGWDRIIMVQNAAFGDIDKLPFDLRGRRVITYNLDNTLNNKADEKQKLKENLTSIFKEALKYYGGGLLGSKDKIVWWGKWKTDDHLKARGTTLHISRVSSDAFFFSINLLDGARSGNIGGKAQILTPHSAYAAILTIDNNHCELVFRRRLEGGRWCIELEQGEECSEFAGHNAYFTGTYFHNPEMAINWGYLDEIDLNEIERLTGDYFKVFMDNLQQIMQSEEEYGEPYTIITSGVKGLYNIMESIIALDKFGSVWCCCLDPEEEVVRYFSNVTDNNREIPKDIEEWLERFVERPLITNVSINQKLRDRYQPKFEKEKWWIKLAKRFKQKLLISLAA